MWNPTSNAILEIIPSVLDNLVRAYNIYNAYEDKDNPWLVVLAAAVFKISSIANIIKGYIPGQMIFGHDTILLMKYKTGWELIYKQNQAQINKDNIRKNE